MKSIIDGIFRHPIVAGTLATVIGGVVLYYFLGPDRGLNESVINSNGDPGNNVRSETIELHDSASTDICGGRHTISVFFHAAIGGPPNSLTLRSSSLEDSQVISTGGSPAVLSPDCRIALVNFRYSGGERYIAVMQQLESP